MPTRRQFLRAGALAAGAAVAGPANRALAARPAGTGLPTRSARRRFPLVNVSADRVIRTIAGLRPFRPSGFNVQTEVIDGKPVVHNYGHGGGGISLSWGTSKLAAQKVAALGGTECAVLGAGALGLSTARLLQDAGYAVTIYAASLPPDTTSNVAGAMWFPVSVFDPGDPVAASPAFRQEFDQACRASHLYFQSLVGEAYGVHWIRTYLLFPDKPPALDFPGGADLYPAMREETGVLTAPYGVSFYTMLVETPHYLDALLRDFRIAGGRIVVQELTSLAEVSALPEPVVVNCTGLGSALLFGDPGLHPIKGQLAILLPQPEIDYAYVYLGPGLLYMFPRRDGIVLGGTEEDGVASVTTNPDEITRILEGHRSIQGLRRSR